MKKEIRITDQKRGIVQVTIADERWYVRESRNKDTELPEFQMVPSVTWICGHYPKGIGFYKWLADKGWDESQAIKIAAGDKGSKVHEAISAILNGEEVRIDSKFMNRSTGKEEELTLEEVDAIKSYVDWTKTLDSYEPVAWDITVYSDIHGYAGSIDLIAKVNGEMYVIDFKTSAQVWPEYHLQVSAYRTAIENGENTIYTRNENGTEGKPVDVSGMKMAILQVGYKMNKAGYKWNEIEDAFPLFMAAKQIWQYESATQSPKKRDYPIVISAGKKKEVFEFGEQEITEYDGEIPDMEAVASSAKTKKVTKAK